jgi:reactive intermediate/imine deaminase
MPTDAHRIQTVPDYYQPFRIAQAYRVGDLVITSGQAAIDKTGNLVGIGDFDAQAEQAFDNLGEVLNAGGSDLAKVIKVTIYLKDMTNFPKILDLRARYFQPPYPADTIVEVTSLALPELEIEIEAMALADGDIVDTASRR